MTPQQLRDLLLRYWAVWIGAMVVGVLAIVGLVSLIHRLSR